MIVKPFMPSPRTLGLHALVARLPSTHPQYQKLQKELKNKEAGDFGEQYITNELQKLQPLSDCHIFHNVILPTILPMQIDILIITPSGIIILEIKNIRGTVHFKSDPRQLIRTTETGEVRTFTHPEIQLEQYIQAMQHFLDAHRITMPLYGAIVFPFNNVDVHREGSGLPIVMGKELPIYIHKLLARKLDFAINDVSHIILSQLQQQKNPFPLCRYYHIEPSVLQRGVYCESCGQFGMLKLKATWFCQKCEHRCKEAHVSALKDFYMLVGDTMTNRECRDFLNVGSPHVTKRLLQRLFLTRSGTGKNTKYNLSLLNGKS
ncbi:nuclease-related domain-containing protein [Lysinibacillus sp. UGB7]|uniref:nuclease-related domain-containing protein n=1 Tax=Lysinibacillus sp. UGB7 TaxID=3411039 RepID=UPI003B76BBF4